MSRKFPTHLSFNTPHAISGCRAAPISASDYLTIALALLATGRFLGSGVCYVGVPGRLVLVICVAGCLITSTLALALPVPSSGNAPLAFLLLSLFFEGPIFPTLLSITLRGAGRRTKLVSTCLTVMLRGGIVWPLIAWATLQGHSGDGRYSLRVTVALFAALLVCLILFNLHPTLRRWADPAKQLKGQRDLDSRPVAPSNLPESPFARTEKGPSPHCPS